MNDEDWIKSIGNFFIASVVGLVSFITGMKATQAHLKTKQEEMEKNILDKIDVVERLMETQSSHIEREIAELKNEMLTIRRDLYKPRTKD